MLMYLQLNYLIHVSEIQCLNHSQKNSAYPLSVYNSVQPPLDLVGSFSFVIYGTKIGCQNENASCVTKTLFYLHTI